MTWTWPQDPTVGDIVTVLECTYEPLHVAIWLNAHRHDLNTVAGRCELYAEAVRLAEESA